VLWPTIAATYPGNCAFQWAFPGGGPHNRRFSEPRLAAITEAMYAPMQTTLHKDAGIAHLRLSGSFTFADRQSFAASHYPLLDDGSVCVLHVDLQDVVDIDSAGLGMLLLLGERARRRRKWVALSRAAGKVEALFQLAGMSRRLPVIPAGGQLESLWCRH